MVGLEKMFDSYFFDLMPFSIDINTVLIEQNEVSSFTPI